DVVRPAGGDLYDGRKCEIADEVFEEGIAGFRAAGLQHSAGHPAVTLVIDGVGALFVWEAAVLRLERRLQVSRIVNRVRPGVTGKEFESAREALGDVDRKTVIVGVADGELSVNAVKRHRNGSTGSSTKASGVALLSSAEESCREACGGCGANQLRIEHCAWTGERRVGSGRPEVVEDGRCGQGRAVESSKRTWAAAEEAECTLQGSDWIKSAT